MKRDWYRRRKTAVFPTPGRKKELLHRSELTGVSLCA
jgi:hypothetical protein